MFSAPTDDLPENAAAPRARLAFLDVEASGLSALSWPIEIGWVFDDGTAGNCLIRPDPTWKESAWDPHAERLHGVKRCALDQDGIDVRDAAARVNAALADCKVYSDAPDWDGFWLFRLFSAASIRQTFRLLDFGRLIKGYAGTQDPRLLEYAAEIAPRRHRAEADARHLRAVWRLAAGHDQRPPDAPSPGPRG